MVAARLAAVDDPMDTPPLHVANPLAPGVYVGVTEAMIRDVVHTFYGRVRADAMLGPVFEAKITDWPAHLAKLVDFWSSVLLTTGRYHGRPMPAHARLPVEAEHFDHWLALFRATVREVCPPPAAGLFIDRAERIAQSLELGVATVRGQFLAPGERVKPVA
jgi:hemoglobin